MHTSPQNRFATRLPRGVKAAIPCALLLVGCASVLNARPDWTAGRSDQYPEAGYLVGVGIGGDREIAENEARAKLSLIFESHVESVSKDWMSHFSEVNGSGQGTMVEKQDVKVLTKVTTDKFLSGVEIKDHWFDGDQKTHYALAVLDRAKAEASLREQIGKLDEEIRTMVDRADGVTDPVSRFQALADAMAKMEEREAFNAELRVVRRDGRGVRPPVGFGELSARFASATEALSVGILIRGEKADEVEACLVSALTDKKMQVRTLPAQESTDELPPEAADVDLLIRGDLDFEQAGRIASSKMVRVRLDMRMINARKDKVLRSWSKTRKEGRPTLDQSISLGAAKLCQESIPEIVTGIQEYFRQQ